MYTYIHGGTTHEYDSVPVDGSVFSSYRCLSLAGHPNDSKSKRLFDHEIDQVILLKSSGHSRAFQGSGPGLGWRRLTATQGWGTELVRCVIPGPERQHSGPGATYHQQQIHGQTDAFPSRAWA